MKNNSQKNNVSYQFLNLYQYFSSSSVFHSYISFHLGHNCPHYHYHFHFHFLNVHPTSTISCFFLTVSLFSQDHHPNYHHNLNPSSFSYAFPSYYLISFLSHPTFHLLSKNK
ncbi:hypothetical protein CISIN_1g033825mg [Citrus sinensis]|uniref:Uncharacterized protein n=1 Tax=Citrus sinensis TaxID=2711 RepID=A0A067DH85_CITSI|nr:hypothetical protein CISIN_1g033825mg [Citrus sinensis]